MGALPEFAGSLTASKNRAIGKAAAQIIVLPPIAYLAYLGLEAIVHLQYRLFHAETLRGQLFVLAGTIFLFAAVVIAGLSRSDKDRGADGGNVVSKRPGNALVHGPRQLFHLFGPIGLLFVPAALRAPALWALAGGVWALEWSIALFAAKVSRRTKGI